MDLKTIQELSVVSRMLLEAKEFGYNAVCDLLEKRIHTISTLSNTSTEDKTLRIIYESGGPIAAVREHRRRYDCSLLESKNYIDACAAKFSWLRPKNS